MGKIKTKPDKVPSRSLGVRPYLHKAKTSFIAMMRRVPTSFMDVRVPEKHSEKIKPYLTDAPYPLMDDEYPTPAQFEYPPGPPWTEREIGLGGVQFKCIIHCDDILNKSTAGCKLPVRCRYGARTGEGSESDVERWKLIPHEPYYDQNDINSWRNDYQWPEPHKHIIWEPGEGLFGEILIYPPDEDWGNIFPSGEDDIYLKFRYIDHGSEEAAWHYHPILKRWIRIAPGKSICDDFAWVQCGCCPAAVTFTFDDDSTPDTIVPGDSIELYVLGGCPPFSWVITEAATGKFNLSYNSTTSRSNTLNAVASACGRVRITVTDACGTDVSINIRCTTGAWYNCTSAGVGGCTDCGQDAYSYTTPICRREIDCSDNCTPAGWSDCAKTCPSPKQWCSNACNCNALCQALGGGCIGAFGYRLQYWGC